MTFFGWRCDEPCATWVWAPNAPASGRGDDGSGHQSGRGDDGQYALLVHHASFLLDGTDET
jgi:hypothetical protein